MNVQTATVSARERLGSLPGDTLVRLALKLDALVTGANGVAYLALADGLETPLGIDAGTLRAIGAFLVAFAAAVWAVAGRATVNRNAVRAVIAANAIWAVDSLVVLAAGWADPETLGGVWIAGQAVVVAGFATFQYAAARRLS